MVKYNIFIVSLLVVIFLGLILNRSYQYVTNSVVIGGPPHYNRRFGLSPQNCPFRSQYY